MGETRSQSDGARIRALRTRLGLSQIELATLLGVSNVTVNRWENDHVRPERETFDRLLRAEHEGIRALTPPVRPAGIASPRSNLPAFLSGLIGRGRELDALCDAVGNAGLITVCGPAGCGKTRLAVEAARAALQGFPDGVWFVDLVPVTTAEQVVEAIAGVLRVTETGSEPLLDRIAADSAGRTRLLVLDNCEHLVNELAPVIGRLLQPSAPLSVLATSRAPLGVPDESVFGLSPLSVAAASELFFARAKERDSTFTRHERDEPVVAEICRRLDGLPLAVEMASSRVHLLSVQQIAARLDDRFRILASPRQPSPAEHPHRTLETAIEWSYELLEPSDRVLFLRLGLFAGTFDLDAIEALADPGTRFDAVDRLVRQSMVAVERGEDGEVRYRLLESFRAFARAKLVGSADHAHALRRFIDHHRKLVADAGLNARGATNLAGILRLDREQANIHAALGFALQALPPDEALAFAASLWPYWMRRGRFAEGVRFLERALRLETTDQVMRAEACLGAAGLHLKLHHLDEARRLGMVALTLSQATGDRGREARAFDVAGMIARRTHDIPAATDAYGSALAIWREIGDRNGEAVTLGFLGQLSSLAGDFATAERIHSEAWAILHGLGDLENECARLADLGDNAARAGQLAKSAGFSERALALARRVGNPDVIGSIQVNLAEVYWKRHEPDRACALLDEAIALFRELGHRSHLADAYWVHGVAHLDAGRPAAALAALQDGVAISHVLGQRLTSAQFLEAVAAVLVAMGRAERAARLLGAAEAIRCELGTEPYELFDYGGVVAATRAALGPRMAQAWSAGGKLRLDQAVLEAITETPPDDDALQPQPGRGDSPLGLTARQIDVLRFVAGGMSNREIADALAISERTVERHLTVIYGVLGVDRRSGAVAAAIQAGFGRG